MPSDFLDDQEFYEHMQIYRHSPACPQSIVSEAFEAVKEHIRAHLREEHEQQGWADLARQEHTKAAKCEDTLRRVVVALGPDSLLRASILEDFPELTEEQA